MNIRATARAFACCCHGESVQQVFIPESKTHPKQTKSSAALNMLKRIGTKFPQNIVSCRESNSARSRLVLGFSKFCAGGALLLVPLSALAAPAPGTLDRTDVRIRAVMAVQDEVTANWMRQPEVIGTAIGLDETGLPALVVYIDREAPRASEVVQDIPSTVRGTNVKVRLTDKFRAHGTGPGANPNGHTTAQTPPIELGTSGGWRKDFANGYCCGGTLGALVSINGLQYILSNYHVFEADIVSGGNGVVAQTGDPIIQPGLPDVNCDAGATQTVATLTKKSALPANNVDCSIGQVVPGMVRSDGSILEIGTLSSLTLAPALNQPVKKSGRTTGLSHSYIDGLNATVTVEYDNECHGGVAFSKTFTGQIIFANANHTFEDSGDSGSLIVEDVATRPRAIGLLFAGSSTSAVANPIDEVLGFLGATIVGDSQGATRVIGISGDLAFGEVGVGSIPPERTMIITNTGNSTLTVSSIEYPAGFSGNWSSGIIPAGSLRSVIVKFSPTAVTSYGGVVTVNCDYTAGVNTTTASGTGVIATRIISVSGDLNFGEVDIEAPPPQRTMTITNTGNSIMTVSGISIPFGFTLNWWSGTIPAHGSRDVIVTFRPTYVMTYLGTVRINSDKTSGADTLMVSGTGTTQNPTRIIGLFTNLEFGNVPVGQPQQRNMTIANNGNSPMTVSSISYPSGFSGNWPGGTIPGGSAQVVTVTFSPVSQTSYGGLVTVNSNATSGTNTTAASGTGIPLNAPAIGLTADLAFGPVSVGGSAHRTMVIVNQGNSPLTVSSVSYPSGFGGNWSSGTVPVGNSQAVTVTFSPLSPISYGGLVTVNSDAISGTNTTAASGSGSSSGGLGRFSNISTRLRVGTGDDGIIGGFIVASTQPARVLIRAIGPSLPVAGALADPTLELRDSAGALMASNDNWRSTQEAEIAATTIPPVNDQESAIVQTLSPGAYTAIVRGVNNATGMGLVEVYYLNQSSGSKLINVSTRGFVETGDNVMIGGTVITGGTAKVMVRAIGPSLTGAGVINALQDPTLELHDGNGALMASNDNWRSDQEAEIILSTIPPANDRESAILRNLAPGNYTAIVRGADNTTGVGLVEAYHLQ